VIAPAASNLKISRRKSLETKSKTLNQDLRVVVAGLNVRLNAMQPMHSEKIRQDGSQASRQIPLAVVRHKRIVPEIPRTKGTANDLIDIDDSRKFAILRKNPITEVNLITYAPQICLERLWGSRSRHPCPMQPLALSYRCQKLRLSVTRWFLKNVHLSIKICPPNAALTCCRKPQRGRAEAVGSQGQCLVRRCHG